MSNKQAILAIDQGTTSSRAIVFSRGGEILKTYQRELALSHPHKGWVEQDPEDIWRDSRWACRSAIQYADDENIDIVSIGITNQRETTIVWDRESGTPVYPAIVWQDRRTADICQSLKEQGQEPRFTDKTGLLLDPYFSGTKIAWILDHVEGARERAEAGELAFGTVDSFLLWRLTGGRVHATDATNAARTLIYNIRDQRWDDELLDILGIPRALLPEVYDNAAGFGTARADVLGRDLPVGGMAGDQQAAMIGQACFTPGMIKSTYGTGCFALMNIGPDFKPSQNRLLTTTAWRLDGRVTYALEGAIFVAGAAVQWLRDNLGLFDDAAESETLARSAADNNGVYFVPAFTGLGAPHWQPGARALITGLSRESGRAHITRAALEAQGYQTYDLMDAMIADSGHDPGILRADGGLVANQFACQFLADILNRPIEIPAVTETTALGAAYLAGLQAGLYKDLDEIAESWHKARAYRPQMPEDEREALLKGWHRAVRQVIAGTG